MSHWGRTTPAFRTALNSPACFIPPALYFKLTSRSLSKLQFQHLYQISTFSLSLFYRDEHFHLLSVAWCRWRYRSACSTTLLEPFTLTDQCKVSAALLQRVVRIYKRILPPKRCTSNSFSPFPVTWGFPLQEGAPRPHRRHSGSMMEMGAWIFWVVRIYRTMWVLLAWPTAWRF